MTVDGVVERHFVDTRKVLGGYHVEVVVTDEESPVLPADETWDHAGTYERPAGVGPLPVQGVGHVGVVVHNVVETIERYHQVFGIEQFRMRDWRTERGLLDRPFYRGEDVEHEYYTGLAPFRDFGFEDHRADPRPEPLQPGVPRPVRRGRAPPAAHGHRRPGPVGREPGVARLDRCAAGHGLDPRRRLG